MSLYFYLIKVKGYSESESEETSIRFYNGMDIPEDIKNDIHDYFMFKGCEYGYSRSDL